MEQQLDEAMRRTRAGNAAAFGPVYDAYIERIFRYVYYRIHHRPTAEDLTADVFMKALASAGSFDATKGTLMGWLYRIAHNAVVDHYRRTRPTDSIEDAWGLAADADTERDAEMRLLDERLRGQLAALTPEQRDVVLLRVWEGLPYGEIAGLLGRSEAGCKMAFARAIRTLRDRLGPACLAMLLSALTVRLWRT